MKIYAKIIWVRDDIKDITFLREGYVIMSDLLRRYTFHCFKNKYHYIEFYREHFWNILLEEEFFEDEYWEKIKIIF
jgi:hypothetical protein